MDEGAFVDSLSRDGMDSASAAAGKNSLNASQLTNDYDGIIQRLRKQIDDYHADQRNLRSQIESAAIENKRLNERLREALSAQSHLSAGDEVADESTARNLQQQLSMALQEKDSMMEMWQASVQEVERLEKQLQSARLSPRVQSLELQAQQIKDQYVRTVAELNQQTAQLHEELKRAKNDLKVSNIQVVDLRKMLEDLRSEMLLKEQRRIVEEGSRSTTERRYKELNQQVTELQTQLVSRTVEIEQLRSEKATLEQRVTEQHRKMADDEGRNVDAISKLKSSFQLAETAVVERDEALVKLRQTEDEVCRLQDALSKIVDEAGARTRQEVDNVKKQCNVNLTKLMEETQRIELESSERQAQLERVLREKRAVESELERIYQDGILQGGRDGSVLNDLTERACSAERSRDEAHLKIDSLNNQIRRLESMHRQEVSRLEAELDLLRDRYTSSNQELSGSNDDRVVLTQKVDELKQQLSKAEQEKNAAQRNAAKQVAVLSQQLQMKEKEYEVKLQALEDSHRRTALELREMITAQQRLSTKWKEECNSITQKMEHKMNDARNELNRERKRTEELTRLLRESREKTIEVEAKLQHHSRNVRDLENRILSSEQRVASSPQIQYHNSASKSRGLSIVESRRQQQRELEFNLKQSLAAVSDGIFDTTR